MNAKMEDCRLDPAWCPATVVRRVWYGVGDMSLDEVLMASELAGPTRRATVGVRDIPAALLAPGRVFAKVEDVPAYAWPLVLLLSG